MDEAYTVSWALVGSFSQIYVMKDSFGFYVSSSGGYVTVMVWLDALLTPGAEYSGGVYMSLLVASTGYRSTCKCMPWLLSKPWNGRTPSSSGPRNGGKKASSWSIELNSAWIRKYAYVQHPKSWSTFDRTFPHSSIGEVDCRRSPPARFPRILSTFMWSIQPDRRCLTRRRRPLPNATRPQPSLWSHGTTLFPSRPSSDPYATVSSEPTQELPFPLASVRLRETPPGAP